MGLFGAALGPLVGRTIDALVPWHATLAATMGLLAMHAIYTGAAGVHIAAVVVVCLGLDLADQVQQVSLTTAVFACVLSRRWSARVSNLTSDGCAVNVMRLGYRTRCARASTPSSSSP